MRLNLKIILLSVSIIIIICLSVLYINSIDTIDESKYSYHKLENEINNIKIIKQRYGKKQVNKRKINRIISPFNQNVIFIKEDKNALEFKITNINKNDLYKLTKVILNNGFKILNFKIKRISPNRAELNCKVLF